MRPFPWGCEDASSNSLSIVNPIYYGNTFEKYVTRRETKGSKIKLRTPFTRFRKNNNLTITFYIQQFFLLNH